MQSVQSYLTIFFLQFVAALFNCLRLLSQDFYNRMQVLQGLKKWQDVIKNIRRQIQMYNGEKNRQIVPLFLSNSVFVVAWSIIFSLIMIFYFSVSLMVITFRINHDNQIVNGIILTILVLIVCSVDMVISINTCFIRNGKLITNRKINLKKYMASWLIYSDVIVILILLVRLILLTVDELNQGTLSVLNLFICLKFYNISRYQKRLKFYYFRQYALLVFQFAKYAVFLGFLCHTVGCLYFMIDALMIEANWYPIQDHWLITSSAMPGLYYAPIWEQYLYSFYVSLVTLSTIAYGDITPLNPTEVSFIMVLLAFLLLFYAYIFTQIYQVITFFNREARAIKEKKLQISHFLQKQQVSLYLRGRIISEYEYRLFKTKKTDKTQFIQDISKKLAKSYNEATFNHQANKFMPRFIRRAEVSFQGFNELISEDFLIPEKPVYAAYLSKDRVDRKMYFVASNRIFRTISNMSGTLTELAEENRWLGVYSFITSQFDQNQSWFVEMPMEVLSLKFSALKQYLRNFPKSEQIFHEQCHHTIYFGGTTEDLQKCLLCFQQYHPAKHCGQHRPKLELQARRFDKNYRRQYQRKNFSVKKIIAKKIIEKTDMHYERQSQTSFLPSNSLDSQFQIFKTFKQTSTISQKVWKWPYYMTSYNI